MGINKKIKKIFLTCYTMYNIIISFLLIIKILKYDIWDIAHGISSCVEFLIVGFIMVSVIMIWFINKNKKNKKNFFYICNWDGNLNVIDIIIIKILKLSCNDIVTWISSFGKKILGVLMVWTIKISWG